jgi:hypothetical protein
MVSEWWAGLEIDDVLAPGQVYAAHDGEGRYLIAHTSAPTWLCAPISERALACVVSGRAELRSAFAHSLTGMVERLTVQSSVCRESVVPCAQLGDEDLPPAGVRLGWQARCA